MGADFSMMKRLVRSDFDNAFSGMAFIYRLVYFESTFFLWF
jgi:hypothetical protein